MRTDATCYSKQKNVASAFIDSLISLIIGNLKSPLGDQQFALTLFVTVQYLFFAEMTYNDRRSCQRQTPSLKRARNRRSDCIRAEFRIRAALHILRTTKGGNSRS